VRCYKQVMWPSGSADKVFPSRVQKPRDLATLTFDLGRYGACWWYGSSNSICVPNLKFVGLSVRNIRRTFGLSISRSGDLDLCSLTLNWCALLPVWCATFLPILVFLGLFFLDVSANTCHTHHVTLRPWLLTFWHLNTFTVYSYNGLPSWQFWALELGRGTRQTVQTDRQTDKRHRQCPLPYGAGA